MRYQLYFPGDENKKERAKHSYAEAQTKFAELINRSDNIFIVHFGRILWKCKAWNPEQKEKKIFHFNPILSDVVPIGTQKKHNVSDWSMEDLEASDFLFLWNYFSSKTSGKIGLSEI